MFAYRYRSSQGFFKGETPKNTSGINIPAYVHRAETADEYDDFYRNEECIDLYKQWVREFLTHENHLTGVEYRNDPTIMMWELGNEIRWKEGWNRESDSLRPWIEEVGPYVKQLAPNQLLTTGIYGWPDGRNDFVEDHKPDSIDVCSLHYYVGPAGYDLTEEEAEAVLDQKIEEAHETLEKPLWLGEYNWGHPDHPNVPEDFSDEFLDQWNSKLKKGGRRIGWVSTYTYVDLSVGRNWNSQRTTPIRSPHAREIHRVSSPRTAR